MRLRNYLVEALPDEADKAAVELVLLEFDLLGLVMIEDRLRGGRGRRGQMPDRLDIHANPIRKRCASVWGGVVVTWHLAAHFVDSAVGRRRGARRNKGRV